MNADERGLNLGASCANLRKPVFICAAVHEIPYEKKRNTALRGEIRRNLVNLRAVLGNTAVSPPQFGSVLDRKLNKLLGMGRKSLLRNNLFPSVADTMYAR